MKHLFALLFATLCLTSNAHAYLTKSVTPNFPLTASRAMVTDSAAQLNSSAVTATELGYVSGVTSALQTQLDAITSGSFFTTCTITSAAAATPIHCVADALIPAGKKLYIGNFRAKVNGATGWGTTATCALQDTAGSPVAFVTWAVAGLTNAAILFPGTANTTYGSAYALGAGGTTAKGLDLACNANGTGSDLVVTVSGVIK